MGQFSQNFQPDSLSGGLFKTFYIFRVLSVIFDNKKMATGSLDRTIRLWDLRDGRCTQVLRGHHKGIWCLSFFTKTLLISGSFDTTIRVSKGEQLGPHKMTVGLEKWLVFQSAQCSPCLRDILKVRLRLNCTRYNRLLCVKCVSNAISIKTNHDFNGSLVSW